MKLSKPEDVNQENSATDSGEAGGTTEMPVVETMLTDRLSLDPKPVDEMVQTNGDVLSDVFGRLGQLESRVEELEERNKQLEQEKEELEEFLERAFEVLDEADSIGEFDLRDRDP